MGAILQNGAVTPGHLASWTTDGVLQDAGPALASNKVLASALGTNFNTTTDQPILLPPNIGIFQLTGIIITNPSLSLTTAASGFYPAASKGGSPLVANTQVYTTLIGANLLLNATLTAFANTARFSSANLPLVLGPNNAYALAIYFSLPTAQGAAATADIYLTGIVLS